MKENNRISSHDNIMYFLCNNSYVYSFTCALHPIKFLVIYLCIFLMTTDAEQLINEGHFTTGLCVFKIKRTGADISHCPTSKISKLNYTVCDHQMCFKELVNCHITHELRKRKSRHMQPLTLLKKREINCPIKQSHLSATLFTNSN